MGENDIILIDNMVAQLVQCDKVTSTVRAEVFQRMAIESLLAHIIPTEDDLDEGLVDGSNDGGIDGFFISVNGFLITDPSLITWPRSGIELEIWISTCKHQDTFKQAPLDNLYSTLSEIMDFTLANTNLTGRYSEAVLTRRTHWMYAFRQAAHRLSSFKINFDYISRGDTQKIGEAVVARSRQIEALTRTYFSNCTVRFRFFGASELVHLSRKPENTPHRLKFREVLSQDNSYLMLVDIKEYFQFVVSEDGSLRRYLFDSNVRDFMGANPVNNDIRNTLRDTNAPEFWWLNNGITILATDASIVGKEISLEQIQIVNGLQTTESIYRHFQSLPESRNEDSVLIKVVQSNDDGIRDAIIRSTNNQTAVEPASLYATDKIQRDIEEILAVHGLYYERRKNHYTNQGYRQSEIVTPLYLGAGYVALGLKNPRRALLFGNGSIQNRSVYNRVFRHGTNLNVWVTIARILKASDSALGQFVGRYQKRHRMVRNWRYVVGFMVTARIIGRFTYTPEELAALHALAFPSTLFDDTIESISTAKPRSRRARGWSQEQIYKAAKVMQSVHGIEGLEELNATTLNDSVEWRQSLVDLDFAMMVDRLLPSQPWKPGVHRLVAEQLGCSIKKCSDAIQFLIEKGIRNQQKDGVVYDSEGNIIDCDEERVDIRKLGILKG